MLNIAYGLRCDSDNDPLLIRFEEFTGAMIQALLPSKFLVVSLVFACAPDKSSNIGNSLEYVSSFEAPSFLDAWWLLQEVG
jgi:hypothetical protein